MLRGLGGFHTTSIDVVLVYKSDKNVYNGRYRTVLSFMRHRKRSELDPELQGVRMDVISNRLASAPLEGSSIDRSPSGATGITNT